MTDDGRAEPPPDLPRPTRRWPDRVISVTPVFAAIVLSGRPDVLVDPDNPPDGLTKAEAEAANDQRCQARVAERAVPGGILVAAGLLIGLVAAVVEWLARIARRRDMVELALQANGNGIPVTVPAASDR